MAVLIALLLYLLSLPSLPTRNGSGAGDESNEDDSNNDEEDEQSDTEIEDEIADIQNPRAKIRALQDHVNRLHRRLDDGQSPKIAALEKRIAERDKTIKELEEDGGGKSGELQASLKDARVRAAFLLHTLHSDDPIDVETAWDLGNVKGFFDVVTVDDDGEVEGMDKAFATLLERYPWVADGTGADEDDEKTFPPKPRTGTSRKQRPPDNGAMNSAAMKERFPALKSRKKVR